MNINKLNILNCHIIAGFKFYEIYMEIVISLNEVEWKRQDRRGLFMINCYRWIEKDNNWHY